MSTGANASSTSSEPIVEQGSLAVDFVDRSLNKVVWNGSVTQHLDSKHKEKSLDLVDKVIVKLLKRFPPKRRKRGKVVISPLTATRALILLPEVVSGTVQRRIHNVAINPYITHWGSSLVNE